MSVSIIIATYGHMDWIVRANAAARSVQHENAEIITVHRDTLAQARNHGAAVAEGDRLVFLDADDTLAPGYADLITEPEDILQPKTIYRLPDGTESKPYYIEPMWDLIDGNHIVVGAPVNKEAFMDVGGFDEWSIAEDWALWLKMRKAGATFGQTTGTYIVNVNPMGRNSIGDFGEVNRIRQTYS